MQVARLPVDPGAEAKTGILNAVRGKLPGFAGVLAGVTGRGLVDERGVQPCFSEYRIGISPLGFDHSP